MKYVEDRHIANDEIFRFVYFSNKTFLTNDEMDAHIRSELNIIVIAIKTEKIDFFVDDSQCMYKIGGSIYGRTRRISKLSNSVGNL